MHTLFIHQNLLENYTNQKETPKKNKNETHIL